MSTKSSLFLTKDNEHCYYEHSCPCWDEKKNYIGDKIILEMSKRNIEVVLNDDEDLIISVKPGSELYELIKMMKN